MSDPITLKANTRQVIGKEVKNLRNEGIIPGVVYGPLADEPISVQMEWSTLRPTLLKAGGTDLINLEVDGNTIQVLVRDVHRHPVRQETVLHVDFYAVDVKASINANVPIELLNREQTSKRLDIRIFQPLASVEVETLPANIPSHIDLDLSALQAAGDTLTVGDLPKIEGLVYLTDEDITVVRTVSLAAIEAAAEEAEAAEEEGDSGSAEVEVIGRGASEDDEEDE